MAEVSGGDGLDAALKALAKKLATAKQVSVGFPEGSRYPDGTSMALVAASQNYGAPSKGIPPRPFFTNAITQHRKEWGKVLSIQIKAQGFDAAKALEATGIQMAGDIAASLVATNGPALSPVTLLLRERFPDRVGMTFADVKQARHDIASGTQPALSGSGAKPLVWTGKLLNHLQGPAAYEVT